jgi:hypothetical protein
MAWKLAVAQSADRVCRARQWRNGNGSRLQNVNITDAATAGLGNAGKSGDD